MGMLLSYIVDVVGMTVMYMVGMCDTFTGIMVLGVPGGQNHGDLAGHVLDGSHSGSADTH